MKTGFLLRKCTEEGSSGVLLRCSRPRCRGEVGGEGRAASYKYGGAGYAGFKTDYQIYELQSSLHQRYQ